MAATSYAPPWVMRIDSGTDCATVYACTTTPTDQQKREFATSYACTTPEGRGDRTRVGVSRPGLVSFVPTLP